MVASALVTVKSIALPCREGVTLVRAEELARIEAGTDTGWKCGSAMATPGALADPGARPLSTRRATRRRRASRIAECIHRGCGSVAGKMLTIVAVARYRGAGPFAAEYARRPPGPARTAARPPAPTSVGGGGAVAEAQASRAGDAPNWCRLTFGGPRSAPCADLRLAASGGAGDLREDPVAAPARHLQRSPSSARYSAIGPPGSLMTPDHRAHRRLKACHVCFWPSNARCPRDVSV